MNYACIRNNDIANGEGVRVSIFVSGCNFHCPGCFNPEAQSFTYGKPYDYTTEQEIMRMVREPTIAGLSILGGDPMCQDSNGLMDLDMLCKSVHRLGKTVWLWTGYTWEHIMSLPCVNIHHQYQKFLASSCDVVVDGPFRQELSDRRLVWKGSSNQRVIDVQASIQAGQVVEMKNERSKTI